MAHKVKRCILIKPVAYIFVGQQGLNGLLPPATTGTVAQTVARALAVDQPTCY